MKKKTKVPNNRHKTQKSTDYYSQRGNYSFPVWEYYVPSMGIIFQFCKTAYMPTQNVC